MKIIVAQFWTKNLSYSQYTKAINEKYCKSKGYIYHIEQDESKILKETGGRALTWYKPKFILEIFNKHKPDYVLFLDADAVVCNESYNIEDFIDPKFDCVVTLDHGPSRMNAGVLLFKNTDWSKKFLKRWWETGDELLGPNEEPKGYYNNALWHDQTCFGYLYDKEGFSENIKIIDNNILNGRVFQDNINKNFIFHAFSYGSHPYRTLDLAYHKIFEVPLPKTENILDIANYYSTDKHYEHKYFELIYNELFKPLKQKCKVFMELGVLSGESLRLWRDYFLNANIIGVDKDINQLEIDKNRIALVSADQSKEEDMTDLADRYPEIDIFLDDGSHKMKDQQITLAKLFKSINPGGVYIIEDLHTSLEVGVSEKSWCDWGDPKKTKTLDMLTNFKEKNEIYSDYMTSIELDYLNNSIDSIEIYRTSPNWSIVGVIKKK